MKEATDHLFSTRNISAAKTVQETANCSAIFHAFVKKPTQTLETDYGRRDRDTGVPTR